MVERIRTLLESRQFTPTQFADLIGVARPIVSHILSGRNKPSLEVVQRILAAMPDLAMPWLLNGSGPMLATTSPSGAEAVPAPVVTAPPTLAATPVPVPMPETVSLLSDSQGDTPKSPIGSSSGKYPAKEVEPAAQAGKPAPFRPASFKAAAVPRRFIAALAIATPPSQPVRPEATATSELAEPTAEPAATVAPASSVAAPDPAVESVPVPMGLPAALPAATADYEEKAAAVAPASATAEALFAGAEKPIRRIVIFYHDGSFADYRPE